MSTRASAPGGSAAEAFLRERFGLNWGPDVWGIAENGVSATSTATGGGVLSITLKAQCSRGDVEKFLHALWNPTETEKR